ncbi:MAG: hypothetical protein J1F42_11955 [Lachnospiraceae bacterium]|nr:hypothetical protein [Lachnospiraceae bacterium]
MKTDLTGINGVSRSLIHSKSTNKLMRQQKALQILSQTGNSKKRDSLSVSNSARNFSKERIAALIDSGVNLSGSELSFYFNNYHNSKAILDGINFGENVSCGYDPNFKEYGVMSFDYNGSRQIVPNYAVPKINTGSLSGIHAVNNSLVLKNKSYYAWTTPNGSRYTWAVNNGIVGWACSESLLAENTNQKGTNYKWEMRKASNILSALAQGKDLYGYNREEVLSVCKSIGFTTGFFSMDAGAGMHHYILQESGNVINVDKEIEKLNNMNLIEVGFKEGDTFSVYGNEYIIDSSGHINVSTDDKFTSTVIIYPSH